ncbi:hypothetical protein HanRHA438_Chr16g0753201 [Helianthus annuus]|nr:hypothetical protein HanRHA438_Chr16g0753201 [Helianthus annuus]
MATENYQYGQEVHESISILIAGERLRPKRIEQSNVTICMVPATLRNLNPSAYTPRITSIGPLHKEDKHLKAMEEHKVTFMYRLFQRTVESTKMDMEQITLKCVQEILGFVAQARACYAPSFTNYDDFKFAEMMVIDACFILELLYRFQYGIAEGDPIFDNILVTNDVKVDLLLLENQIPFFILEDMNIINDSELTITDETVEHCHILGFIQSCYRPSARTHGEIPDVSYSATEIAGAGVRFKAQSNKNSLLAVKFEQSYIVPWLVKLFVRETCFKIPVLNIKNSTPTLLRNLIAYEQCYPLSRHYVTSFAFLMDRLIDTKDDVSLLLRSKVIQHHLGASEDVTNLFNNICNGVVLRDFYYTDEWRKLDKYCNQFWPSILISLRRIYRSTTWKTLTVIAALIIFCLTLVQTIFTVRNA